MNLSSASPSRGERTPGDGVNGRAANFTEHAAMGPNWPAPLNREAFHGLAGEAVRLIEPASESDEASLLLQTLVALGNLMGRKSYFAVEGTKHTTNMYVVLVGMSSKSRKGTSWGRVRQLLHEVDPGWTADRIQTGLVSGEGLIEAVADSEDDKDAKKDKRLLVLQDEFASVLKIMNREGNILSAIIRSAWDSGHLSSLARSKNKLKATEAHISQIGHITRDELRRYLTETEAGNGFGNRYLWAMSQRSKCLPDGGTIEVGAWAKLIKRMRCCIEDFVPRVEEMKRDEEASEIWRDEYPKLSEGSTGMFGSMTSRAEAQVVRLSMIYALLDESMLIRAAHLNAALAVWRYAEQSARFIFGGALGDPVADTILEKLAEAGDDGFTRTQISQIFNRNKTANQIDCALRTLQEYGRIRMEREQTEGRPVERWKRT